MRLTIRNSDGTVSQPMNLDWSAALEKLAAYEDTGLEPDEIDFCLSGVISPQEAKERYEAHKNRYDEWLAWKQAEEQGRMVILPCKVGTPVWSSVMCRFDENGEEQPMQWPFMLSMMDEWGTGFFLTYEEAEAALKGEGE